MSWTGNESLDLDRPLLLEASAGTGKTWQIANLVARLVVVEGVSIDRLLVITFTNAATSELRDRIRRRLVAVRACLEAALERPDTLAEHEELLVTTFCVPEEKREEHHRRVRAALSGFDRASISTIHSFSQRMLDQFAFESGQEAELELVADATELAEEYVADLMANAYAGATERELGALEDLGFNPKRVRTLVKEMTRAVTPELRPDPATLQGLPSTPLAIARRWCKEVDSVGAFVGSEEGEAALTGIGSLRGKKGKELTASQAKKAEEAAESLREWVADGGRKASIGTSAKEEYLRGKRATSAEEDPEYARVAPLFDKVNGALTLRERLDAAMAVYVAEHARRHLETELERRRWLTFNAILSRLAARISDPDSGSELAAAIRDRYEVALVDEFQDTDSAQWAVLKAVFANVSRRLILIGDPKQAIYAFRDADIYVYLQAKGETKARRETMTTNYRTDRSLVQAMNHLWQEGSGAFMTDAIEYVEVEANHGDGRARLPDLPCGRSRAPLELRWANVHTLRGEHPREGEERIDTDEGRQLAGYLCAREAAALLRTGHRFFPEKSGDERRLRAQDMAVLVSSHKEARAVEQALAARGIACIRGGRANVFDSGVVDWLTSWLLAVAAAGRGSEARALYTNPLFGHTACELDEAMNAPGAETWTEWVAALSGWLKRWPQEGFVGVFEAAMDEFDVMARVLRGTQGERAATDLRHLMELCHVEERRTRVGPAGLAAWLQQQRDRAASEGADEQLVRLERDDDAVQIVTIHASKGLEYAVVLLPFGSFSRSVSDKRQPIRFHEGEKLYLDVHPRQSEERTKAMAAHKRERREEEMRHLYVAMTRASHHMVVWCVGYGTVGADGSPLGRLLLRERAADGQVVGRGVESLGGLAKGTLETADVTPRLEILTSTSGGKIAWSAAEVVDPADDEGAPQAANRHELPTATWSRDSLRSRFLLTSYSGLSSGGTVDVDEPARGEDSLTMLSADARGEVAASAAAMMAEPVSSEASDDLTPRGADAQPLPLTGMRGGTSIGTWAHAVLEHLDFQTADGLDGTPRAELIANLGARHGVRRTEDHVRLGAALPAILSTPMGHPEAAKDDLLAGVTLGDLTLAHRLDELRFDLRLGQGTDYLHGREGWDRHVDEAAVGAALHREREASLGAGDTHQAAYLEAVLERAAAAGKAPIFWGMAGIMGGFIDLTFRVPLAGADPKDPADPAACRYYVCDYKTNHIAPKVPGAVATATQFTRPWMAWEMGNHGYYLQSMVYQLALHRMLRGRLGERYDPQIHLGGYVYLFLRGMTGSSAVLADGAVQGVYRGCWSPTLLASMDAALDGRPLSSLSTQEGSQG